jgi:hypothetical protein
MIISDLSYSTVVDANVIGGTYKKPVYKKPSYYNVAYADAYALAVGPNTKSGTYTYSVVAYGLFSESKSSSYAKAY